jgi:uncharacterized membrane protein YkvA (DUF1232 family)
MKFFQKIKNIPSIVSEIKILFVAYTDKRTPFITKIVVVIASLGYLLMPFDAIMDFIPVLGILDDVTLITLLLAIFSRWIPQDILDDARKHILAHKK